MPTKFAPLREISRRPGWTENDVLVVIGEVFNRGYVNGLIEEAKRSGARVIFTTVGRRNERGDLRPLSSEELRAKDQPLINVPLEAGFDLEPDQNGETPVSQLAPFKLSEWQSARVKDETLRESRRRGGESFRSRLARLITELETHLSPKSNILFAHTMAGGVPRAKIVMPAMNRVFKGVGDRYASSQEFWESPLGRFCDASFMDVTAETFRHLIELTSELRRRQSLNGARVSYVAYGYHGCEVLVGDNYEWRSYAPYLQGFAKIRLEEIASEAMADGISATVFNAPEILTNSSSIFLGVEVGLYQLLSALERETGAKARPVLEGCQNLLRPEISLGQIKSFIDDYFRSDIVAQWTKFDEWPQHNGPGQMARMRETSDQILSWHRDPKHMLTEQLSEIVFRSCGRAMWAESWAPERAVWWIGHDLVAKLFL